MAKRPPDPGMSLGKVKPEALPFFAAQGSDPDAPMKGDFQQQVPKSSKMQQGKPIVRPKPVKSGGAYRIGRANR